MKKILIVFLVIAAFGLFLSFQMLGLAKRECRLCINFKGQKICRTAYGPDDKGAMEEAHRNACADVAQGVTEVLACNRVPDEDVVCANKGELRP